MKLDEVFMLEFMMLIGSLILSVASVLLFGDLKYHNNIDFYGFLIIFFSSFILFNIMCLIMFNGDKIKSKLKGII